MKISLEGLERTGLATFGEGIEEAFGGDAFAAVDLGHALFEPCVEGGLGAFKPLFFCLEEVEGVFDDFGGEP